MRQFATYIVMVLLMSSCATLNISEIKNLEKIKFDSLTLKPGWETNNLRIDLIRQSYEENINDSTRETKETPYHSIGFDLGNGLFYDLNENLSLRLDYIFGFSKNDNFELNEITRPQKNKGYIIYRFINDTLLLQYPPRPKNYYLYHKINNPDSIAFMYKKRLLYAITETDSTLVYSGKKRKWDVINKIDDNNYYLNKKKWKKDYKYKDNNVFLENDYVVSLTDNNSRIEIKSPRKNRPDRMLYIIEKSSDKLFIYNEKYSGILIKMEGNSILIYRDKTLIRKYELKSGTTTGYKI